MTEKSKDYKKIMKKIKKGQLKMKPKIYFVFGSILFGAGVVGLLLLSAILMSRVFFDLRLAGAFRYLGMGGGGMIHFFRRLPIKMLLLAGAGLGGGSFLIRKHGRGYKMSLIWLLVGVITTVMGLGWLMDRIGLNERCQRGCHWQLINKTELVQPRNLGKPRVWGRKLK